MKITQLLLITTGLWVSQAAAEEPNFSEAQTNYMQPCDSWTYNSTVGGYVCRFYQNVEIATGRDVRDLQFQIDRLETKVDNLERRVTKLENDN